EKTTIYLVGKADESNKEKLSDEKLAELFHKTYEDLAPSFGYKTRDDSAKPWEDVPAKNKKLMIAVCAEIRDRFEYGPRHQPPKRIEGAVARLEALASFAGEIDEEALEDEVTGIAREFSAEDLKEIAKKFGIKKGIGTKAATLDSLLAKVCEKRD